MKGGAVIVGNSKGGHPNEKGNGVLNSSIDDVGDGR